MRESYHAVPVPPSLEEQRLLEVRDHKREHGFYWVRLDAGWWPALWHPERCWAHLWLDMSVPRSRFAGHGVWEILGYSSIPFLSSQLEGIDEDWAALNARAGT